MYKIRPKHFGVFTGNFSCNLILTAALKGPSGQSSPRVEPLEGLGKAI